jgi:exo-beta-1,3-glucanase (GH17 family)
MLFVGSAAKLWLGRWVSDDASVVQGELETLEAMLQSSSSSSSTSSSTNRINLDRILCITVGSEAIYRAEVSVDQMIAYFQQVKDLLTQYDLVDRIPVTIVDTDTVYAMYPQL